VGRLGYYLYAGNLTSNGLRPHTGVDENNVYAKLQWELPERGTLLYTIAYNKSSRDDGQVTSRGFSLGLKAHSTLSTLSLKYPLSDRADLDISLRTTFRAVDATANTISSGELLQLGTGHEATGGGSASFAWRHRFHSIVVGTDFDHKDFDFDRSGSLFGSVTEQHFKTDKWGVYVNDTLTVGTLAITPGLRYDSMRQVGYFISPSLGVAWSLDDKTVLRAYAARGYSLPIIIPGATQERVFAVQAGIETSKIPYLWLKAGLFRNQISDIANRQGGIEKHLKQGVEVEARTVPLFNTSLTAGYTFIDATNRESGQTLENIPSQIVKLGLSYDDRRSLRGALLGRYAWWNASPDRNASYRPIIWDLNVSKKVLEAHDMALELFFSAHNIFNGAQYSDGFFKNARRWLEGGARFSF